VEKMRSQVSDLMERNAKIVDENNIYIQERNTSYNDFTNAHKKKMAELEDAKESLQIEVSNAATELAKAGRRYENLKKQALNMQDEFNSTKEDLERERSLREKEKHELETVTAELNNIKQKYREDSRKMKETIHDRDDLQTQLNTAREQIERLNKIVEERTQQLSKDKATVELAYIQERNNLIEQLESINTELRNERISAARRIQESEESAAAQLKQHIEELRAKASKELERRVGIAVENALANATALSEESKQQALTAARIAFNEEKDRSSRILQENFNARLQEEIKLAYEKGRQVGLKDSGRNLNVNDGGALHQLKEMEFENLKQSYEREIANQKRLIASLSSNAPAPSKGFSLDEVSQLVKNIVNETFKSIREEFHPDQNYSGEHVTASVKNILVTKTIGGIPKEEPRYSEPVVHVHNTDSEPVHRPAVQSVPIHSPEAPKPTQFVPPPEEVPERFVPAAVTRNTDSEPEPESEPVITTQQRFVSVPEPEPEPEPEPVITSEPALEKQAPPEPEESPDNTAPKSRFSAFHDADSDSDTDAVFTTETQHPPQTPEPSATVSHQNQESPSDTTESEKIPVTTETKPEEVLTGKSQDKSEDKQDTDWDDDEEEPEKPEPQTTSQPTAVPSGPPPVKANAFSFLDDSDEDSDPFFSSSKKKTADDHDPFDFGTKKKEEDTTKSKTSNGTTSASNLSDPLDVPTTTKDKTTTTKDKTPTKEKAPSTGSDWMFGETPKDNPLGDIFGSSDKTKTTTTSTTSSTTKKKAKSAFDDDEEDDFLGGFKDPLVSSKKTDAKDIWGDDDGSDLFG
jgi:D-ribose pyranose/furanose isomerase RbsD